MSNIRLVTNGVLMDRNIFYRMLGRETPAMDYVSVRVDGVDRCLMSPAMNGDINSPIWVEEREDEESLPSIPMFYPLYADYNLAMGCQITAPAMSVTKEELRRIARCHRGFELINVTRLTSRMYPTSGMGEGDSYWCLMGKQSAKARFLYDDSFVVDEYLKKFLDAADSYANEIKLSVAKFVEECQEYVFPFELKKYEPPIKGTK